MIEEITEQIRACCNDRTRVVLEYPEAMELLFFLDAAQAKPEADESEAV